MDVSYGGEAGFNQAIELSAETLGSVKLVQEKKLIQKWFDEIAQVTALRNSSLASPSLSFSLSVRGQ